MASSTKQQLKGKAGFTEYYAEQLGLLDFEPKPVILPHPQLLPALQRLWMEQGLTMQPIEWYPTAWYWPAELPLGSELPGYVEGLFYVLNAASLKPVVALNVQADETILDACAAPGGKTVAIAHQLNDTGRLDCTDSSSARVQRLRTTVQSLGYSNITTTVRKAETIFKKLPNHYDGILLDAPCSSEKHVWHNEHYLGEWSYSRIKRLKQQQIALLNGLWLALKPGGRIVYVTCALNKEENEGVMADFQQRHPEGKITQQERIIPDSELFDPLFYARIEKPL